MTHMEIAGLVLSYIYASGILFGVEALGKVSGWPQTITRKVIHISAGMWVWGILFFFDRWYLGVIPFASFIPLNYLFYRQRTFKAMDTGIVGLGTVYFAVSATLLYAILWRPQSVADHAAIATAAMMAMTWGDAFASIVGTKWGNHAYSVFSHVRSWEGSAAMAIFSFLGIFCTLYALPGSTLSPHSAASGEETVFLISICGAFVATIAEAISPKGSDNLTVPLITALVLWILGA